MPDIIIVAGPNGAGKTSFAREYLPLQRKRYVYVNADEIERTLRLQKPELEQPDLAAARLMLQQVDDAISAGRDLMLETTLATRIYARKADVWRLRGYSIGLVFLRLPSEDHAVERVRRRVAAGGHDIPESVIRRRFHKSALHLETIYKPLVDEWYVWNSLEGEFVPAEAWDQP